MDQIAKSKQNGGTLTIGLIILASAILRFINLGTMSLSNDELSSLVRVRYDSFSEMISKGVYIDFHPAGLQSFLFYWVKIFGEETFIVRFPFVLFSLISTWLIYKIGKRWYNELTGLLAACTFGFSIFTILFTQLARMYSPGIMFSLLTVYFWTEYLFPHSNRNKNYLWFGWIISMSAALHLHYFSFMFVGLVGLSGLFFVNRNTVFKYTLGGFIALITFLPELPVFFSQMKTGDIGGWLGPPSKNFLKDFFFELFNRSYLVCTLVGLLFVSGLIFGKNKAGINRWRLLSATWFGITFLIAYIYSILGHPVLMFSTLHFVIPLILLLIFSYIPKFLLTKRNTIIFTLIFSIVLIYDTVVPGKNYSIKQFGVFKEIAEDVEGWSKKYGVKNVPIVINVVNTDYLNYYFHKMELQPLIVGDKIETPSDFTKLINITRVSKNPYFGFVWTNSSHPWEIPEIIRKYYPFLIEQKNYFNAASYLFAKHQADTVINTQVFSSMCDFDYNLWSEDFQSRSTEQVYSGVHSQKINGEYGVSFSKKLSDIPGKGFRYITFSAMIFLPGESENIKMIISLDRNNKPFDYHGSNISDFKIKKGEWQPVIVCAEFPKEILPEDILLTYFWNPSNKLFYIDDLKVEVNEGIDPYKRFTRGSE